MYRILEDLHTRSSYEHPRRTFIQAPTRSIFKILTQGPLEEDFNRTSSRSSRTDLYKIMLRPLTAFHQDVHRIFSHGLVQDLGQDLHARIPKRMSLYRHERTCCCWSGSQKILIQEPPKSLPQELSHKHLKYMASARSSCTDLLGRISQGQGSPQDLLLRTCTGSCKDLLERT